ncbi:hypothetical protein HEK131_11580 [Streptomyces seoulensis]|nr:hypothetical protein HEK131_11580 [Streptomyces seoulensis]
MKAPAHCPIALSLFYVNGAVSGPSEGGPRQPLTTNNDHEGATDCRALSVRLSS